MIFLKKENDINIINASLNLLSKLSTHIAHELKSPLVAIQAGAEGSIDHFNTLIEAYKLAKEAGLIVDDISPQHLSALKTTLKHVELQAINANFFVSMLVMNMKINEIANMEKECLSIKEIFKQVVYSFPIKNSQHRNLLKSICNFNDFFIIGNADIVKNVFNNLLKNVISSLEKSGRGTMRIETETRDTHNYFHVMDSGIGIANKDIKDFFSLSYFTDKNIGLGLPFCWQAMKSMDGSLMCDQYQGFTRFTLLFPRTYDYE